MAIPAQEEYGAIRAPEGQRSNSKAARLLMVGAAIAMCMVATVLLSSNSATPFDENIELEAFSPQAKLNSLVNDFAIHGSKMTVKEMEAKLDQWGSNPETLLDLPQNARTQVTIAQEYDTTIVQ
jgi:hypothetical protein